MTPKERVLFITGWILDYCSKMPKKPSSLVIGVSGGIDSAVVSTICASTGMKTFALSMPIKQIKEQDDLSKAHCEWLQKSFANVEVLNVNLDNVFNAFEEVSGPHNSEHAFANSRARLRMTTLYQIAGSNNGIVVGTGNKVEDFGVGFYTKYGDGGVDLSPIADLMKSEVYAIASFLGVNQDIQKAAPTDGLWGDDRTDEDQLGASYDELEWAMKAQEAGKEIADFTGRQQEVYKIYLRLNKANLHKMNPIPVCEIPENLK